MTARIDPHTTQRHWADRVACMPASLAAFAACPLAIAAGWSPLQRGQQQALYEWAYERARQSLRAAAIRRYEVDAFLSSN